MDLNDMRTPLQFGQWLWPHYTFYNKQRACLESLQHNDETHVPAGNQLGKDFIAGFLAVSFFLRPQLYFPRDYCLMIDRLRSDDNPYPHTVRIITTSVKDDHLRVLWGEIGRFVQTSRASLNRERGGPLVVNHREIRKIVGKSECPISYLRGMVSDNIEGMAGHHAAYTLIIGDEASGIDDAVYEQAQTWAKKMFFIGNCNPCENFFKRAVKGGDLTSK